MSETTPKFTNRLINESSPYLQHHAHNPVDWFAWSEEAFEKARAEDKPIHLSVGYRSCHWCNVLNVESFEDEMTARIMNENFVNIKVDKEERPDVDQIYMNFIQLIRQQGGHPMTVFMTPDGVPFYGGTYFPPEPRYGMPSFSGLLISIADAYRERREEITESAAQILGELKNVGQATGANLSLSPEQLESAFRGIEQNFDAANGGFGGAPKFPAPMSLEFCLRHWKRTGDANALEIVKSSATKMARGGIYDQLGGGFHRYTVDAVWLTPHFEKMLTDNAQLALLYLHLFQATRDDFFKSIAVETLEYIAREMTDERGGFYSSTDADSEGEEGKFFVWSPAEIEQVLGADDAAVFNFYYDVTDVGNFEGHNILNVHNSKTEAAQLLNIDETELTEILERGRKLLFEKRKNRVPPFRDEKVLAAWNGLMLAAFAEAGAILDRADFRETAIRNADFMLAEMIDGDGLLLRSWKNGTAKIAGFVEDYANVADGLTTLYQTTGSVRYLRAAKNLADQMIAQFWDMESGGFFFTGANHEDLIVQSKDFFDNAMPSGNSVAADVLLKLAVLTGDENYHRTATSIFRLTSESMNRYPQAFGRMLCAFDFYLNPTREIVVIGDGKSFERAIWDSFVPNKIVVSAAENNPDAEFVPLLQERKMIDGKPTVYVCENFTCQTPVTTAEELNLQLHSIN